MSSAFQSICREIDTVTVKGSIKPMRLYTISFHTDDLEEVDDELLYDSIKNKKKLRDQLRKDMFQRLFSGTKTTWEEFTEDPDFIELRKKVDPEFEVLFASTYELYIKGDWEKAGEQAE